MTQKSLVDAALKGSGTYTPSFNGTAPTGMTNSYSWVQIGKQVTFRFRTISTTGGSGNSYMTFGLPAGTPTPSLTGISINQFIVVGAGWLGSESGGAPGAVASMYYSGPFDVYVYGPTASAVLVMGTIVYLVD